MSPSSDRWIDIAIRTVLVLVLGVVVYAVWTYASTYLAQKAASPADRAIENLARAVRAQPQNPNARIRLAEALAAAGRTDESIEQFKAALTIDKEFTPAMAGIAKVAMQRKEWRAAESYWNKIIEKLEGGKLPGVDAKLDEAYYGLGVVYLETERYEDAVDPLKRALGIRKDASDTHYMLSVAYRELDLPEKQKQELDITLAFDPNNPQANYDRGLAALVDGDEARAAELFRVSAENAETIDLPDQELEKLAGEKSATERLANARKLATTKVDVALSDARVAAALEPENAAAVRLVAQLWDRKKQPDMALNAWKRLLEIESGDTEALAAVKRLEKNGDK